MIAHADSGRWSFVPFRAVSDGQSLFVMVLNVAQKCFNYGIFSSILACWSHFLFRGIAVALSSESQDSNASLSHPSMSLICWYRFLSFSQRVFAHDVHSVFARTIVVITWISRCCPRSMSWIASYIAWGQDPPVCLRLVVHGGIRYPLNPIPSFSI